MENSIFSSSTINTAFSNNSVIGMALADSKNLYCSLLVPKDLCLQLCQSLFVDLYPSALEDTEISYEIKPLITHRPLVSSLCFSLPLDITLNVIFSPLLVIKNVAGGLSISVATMPGFMNIDPKLPIAITTLVGKDSHLSANYFNYYLNSNPCNHLIFTDQRMHPHAASQIAQACRQHPNLKVTIFPVISPYYHILNYSLSVNHIRPADSALTQQQDYFFILLPLMSMISQLISHSYNVRYLTFCDMDERQLLSSQFINYLNAHSSDPHHLLLQEINVYADSPKHRQDLNSFTANDIIFPRGRRGNNCKIIYNTKKYQYSLDSPHGVVEDYSNYRQVKLSDGFYLHFFNVTGYKRVSFADCSNKVDKYSNFRFSQATKELLKHFDLQVLNESSYT